MPNERGPTVLTPRHSARHDIAYQRSRLGPATGQQERDSLILLPFLSKKSLDVALGRAAGGSAGSGACSVVAAFVRRARGLHVWPHPASAIFLSA
jgi:hypothetical protein